MSKRSAKFGMALFAALVASSFTALAEDAVKEENAKAADTCVSVPKGSVPAGSHWYYRIDHATKRNCWYIGEEKDKTARAASKAYPRTSIADARAELAFPRGRGEPDAAIGDEPRPNVAQPVAGLQNAERTIPIDPPSSPVASRWPDASDAGPVRDIRVAAVEPPETPQTRVAATKQNAVSPAALVTADPTPEKQPAAMQMLLLAMLGALALAGVTASLVFSFGRKRVKSSPVRGDRRATWDSIHTERTSPSIFPNGQVPMRHTELSLDPRAPNDAERQVTEMLSRLARSAQT